MAFPDLKDIAIKIAASAKRHPGITAFSAAAIFYAVCTFFYMGAALTDCSNSLTGGVGDNTAGLIWLNSVDHVHPFWSFTHVTNYPFGEHLDQPVFASGASGYILYWLLAGLAGSVCGYNLLNAVGYLSASLIMFGFVLWLTRGPWIALLAGYAVAFTPYLQIKNGVHSSYIFEGLFVAILWIFLIFWKRPQLLMAVSLGLLTAVTFYWDAYFMLLGGVLWAGMLMGAIAYELLAHRHWGRINHRLKYGLAAFGTLAVLLSPLAYIRLHYASQINSVVSNSRNAIKFDANIYSAHPVEYLRPTETQPVLKKLIPGYATHRNHHSSNAAEYTINLSITLLIIILAAVGVLAVRCWSHRHLIRANFKLPVDASLIFACVIITGIIAFAFSLPPTLAHHRMPTWYLTNYITIWRVFARLYIIVNLMVVTTAALALVYLSTFIKRPLIKRLAWPLVFALVAFEYQTFVPPRPVWTYSANLPPIYYRLHARVDVHVVAEYPLDEPAVTVWPTYYQTYQRISGKAMINSDIAGSPQAPLRGSLRTLADPQSVPALRALGADAVIVHGVVGSLNIPGLKLIDYEAGPPPASRPDHFPDATGLYPIAVYQVLPGPKVMYVTAPETGFVPPQLDRPVSYDYVGENGSTLRLLPLPGAHDLSTAPSCFQAHSPSHSESVTLRQGGRVLWSGTLTSDWQEIGFSAKVSDPISASIDDERPISFMLHNLGCLQ